MSLPRLRATLTESRDIARVLRAALRHEIATVPLMEALSAGGQHLLEIDLEGNEVVMLLADPAGPLTDKGQPLHVRPITRPQAATLFELVERLDEPSTSMPPEEEPPAPSSPPDDGDTVYDPSVALRFDPSIVPASFGRTDSAAPEAPESAPPISPSISGLPLGSGVFSAYGGLPAAGRSKLPPAPPPTEAPDTDRVKEVLLGRLVAGKYRLESMIGEGSTAAVYRALHVDLKRPVAVKILHQRNRGEIQFVRRFRAEALAASKLEHVNVTRVLDFGQEPDGLLYLVMELLDGRSLESVLTAHPRLPQAKAVEIAVQVAGALAFAHDDGIIHRDIKPENIVLVGHRDDDGRAFDLVKVCDFGLAKLRDPDPEAADITIGGMLCGSPAYMSPEQARGEELDPRTDIYSLGVTLFESLTGALPHDGGSIVELLLRKAKEPPRSARELRPDLDPLLEDVLMRALATDREDRHATVRVLREELREALSNLEVASDDREPTIVAD